MQLPIRRKEYDALVQANAFDRYQAEQRFANLMATRIASGHHYKFCYWPKQPVTILDLLA